MEQNANNNPNDVGYFKAFITDLFGGIFKGEIFTTKEIGTIRTNAKSINQMNIQEKRKLLESLDNSSAINSDFKDLKSQYLCEATDNVNIEYFKKFIKRAKSGYYYSKAKILFFIRSLLITPQFLFMFILLYPMLESESIDKVDKIKFCLRGLVLFPDIIFFFCENYVLKNLERIKLNKPYIFLIIVLQLTKFTCNVIIFVIDLSRNNRENSLDNKNLFLLNNNIIEKMENIYDLLKFWI